LKAKPLQLLSKLGTKMPDSERAQYLSQFARRAEAAGLNPKRPGQTWLALRDIVRGSHVSLSVARHQIQVNLNNEDDEDRSRFERLYADRASIAGAIGSLLDWEKKKGRKKTAVRVTLAEGFEDTDTWDRQHDWAVAMMKKFELEFGRRLLNAGE
jgi:hypothetical protein